MATTGQEFTTGQVCPQSGVYAYVGHSSGYGCSVTPAQREIPLSKGETFPPISGCGHAARWRLVRYA
ncbi:MAG: YjzC family protein [Chloroflexota bacterium]|nr:MAG: YjzC family protein [Chloroflexota bacterium]